jgi:putative oxygen-independent coproporphyrinogen III oxidase
MNSIPLALYVHMPWCVRKCPYCDFNSHQLKSALPDASYIDTLLLDLEHEAPRAQGREIDTVFFGGGTPSLFSPAEFARFLTALRARFPVAQNAEITLEANPGTIERGAFAGYAEAGINRVSMGAQSFDADALAALGRIHSPQDTQRAVAELRAAGIANFNLDLMYALPRQSQQSARRDVLTAIELQPAHISYYQLTLEPGTVFHSRPPPLPDEDASWDIQLMGQELMGAAGYGQYEVSAYARPDARCRHNLNYWRFGDYLGIGAGAHGKLTLEAPGQILRTVKPKQPRDYQERIRSGPVTGEEAWVAPAQLPFEFMLNALRLNEGFRADLFEERTGLSLESVKTRLGAAQQAGLLEPWEAGWRPTTLGRRFLNDLQAAFLDDAYTH